MWWIIKFTHAFTHLFRVLHHFQHCTGHITTGSWKGRGNQYIKFVRVLYCKLPTNGKHYQLSHLRQCREPNPASELGGESVTTLPLCPLLIYLRDKYNINNYNNNVIIYNYIYPALLGVYSLQIPYMLGKCWKCIPSHSVFEK